MVRQISPSINLLCHRLRNMGDWDTYCAVCGVDAHQLTDDQIGSRHPEMLAIRRKKVAEVKEECKNDDNVGCGVYFDEDDGLHLGESTQEWDWEEEEASYDPDLIDDMEWLGDVQCLAFDLKGGRAFFSGDASIQSYGLALFVDGLEPDEELEEVRHWGWQERREHHCYWTIVEGESIFFPIHTQCRTILDHALRTSDKNVLDTKALYEAMCLLSTMFDAKLTVDYGKIEGNLTFWECHPGEEYVVSRPEISTESKKVIADEIAAGKFDHPKQRSTLQHIEKRTIHDPFDSLSNELLVQIAEYIPASDLLSCCTASWAMMNASSTSSFWKDALRRDMPWATSSLQEVLQKFPTQEIDYKRLFLWFEKMTRPEFAMDAPWLGAGNRRRIWSVCEQIAEVYWERKGGRKKKELM